MRAQRVYENIKFERGQDPKEAMGVGVNPNNYFWNNLEHIPFLQAIEKHGLWPNGEALDILRVASEMLGVSEENVYAAVEYGDEYLTSNRIEDIIDNHEWEYVLVGGNTEGFNLIPSSTGEIYVVDIEEGIPSLILGAAFPKMNENVSFERGRDPKEALSIGLKANNSWNHNPPPNILVSKWREEKDLGEDEEEIIQKAAKLLHVSPNKIRLDIMPLDDWDEEFKTWNDYYKSPKYFDENMTYLGNNWEFTPSPDLESEYDDDQITKSIPLEKSDSELHLGKSGLVYLIGDQGVPWVLMGTIY